MIPLTASAMNKNLFVDDGEQVAAAVTANLSDVSLFVFSNTDLHSKILLLKIKFFGFRQVGVAFRLS